MRQIFQFAPIVLYGDAVGNQIVEMHRWLTQRGFASRVFAPTWDKRFDSFCARPEAYRSNPNHVVILQHCVGSPMADLAMTLSEQVVLYYHNITPAHFYADYEPGTAQALVQGRQQFKHFVNSPYALAGSEYNEVEMRQMGFKQVDHLPLFLHFEEMEQKADPAEAKKIFAKYRDGKVNWLFLGRLAPNKRQDNVIRAFAYYHRLVNPNSRLIFVGSQSIGMYVAELRGLAYALGVSDAVVFAGHVKDEVLAAYYQCASVYVSLSEHEGLSVPVLQAMHFGIPVVALNEAALPYTLGDAGILVNTPRPDAISEMIELILQDGALREKIVTKQRERLAAFSPERAKEVMEKVVDKLTKGDE